MVKYTPSLLTENDPTLSGDGLLLSSTTDRTHASWVKHMVGDKPIT